MKGGPLLDLLNVCPHGCGHARHLPGLCRAMSFVFDFAGKGRSAANQCACEAEPCSRCERPIRADLGDEAYECLRCHVTGLCVWCAAECCMDHLSAPA